MLRVVVSSWADAVAVLIAKLLISSAACATLCDDRANCSIALALDSTTSADFSAVAATSSTDAAISVTALALAPTEPSNPRTWSATPRTERSISSAPAATLSAAALMSPAFAAVRSRPAATPVSAVAVAEYRSLRPGCRSSGA